MAVIMSLRPVFTDFWGLGGSELGIYNLVYEIPTVPESLLQPEERHVSPALATIDGEASILQRATFFLGGGSEGYNWFRIYIHRVQGLGFKFLGWCRRIWVLSGRFPSYLGVWYPWAWAPAMA